MIKRFRLYCIHRKNWFLLRRILEKIYLRKFKKNRIAVIFLRWSRVFSSFFRHAITHYSALSKIDPFKTSHKKWIFQNYNFQTSIFIWLTLLKNCNGDKKTVKATKKDYLNRYGCSLYGNKARLSVSQMFVTVTKSLFRVCARREIIIDKAWNFASSLDIPYI